LFIFILPFTGNRPGIGWIWQPRQPMKRVCAALQHRVLGIYTRFGAIPPPKSAQSLRIAIERRACPVYLACAV
jgi:hypothetical protein